MDARKQEPKKRGRVSVRSKADSDDEVPERSPVRPSSKKQKKEKSTASARKEVEPISDDDDDDLDLGAFAPMDKYMHVDSWDDLIDKIDTIERSGGEGLYIYGTLYVIHGFHRSCADVASCRTTKENFRLSSSVANVKFPQKVGSYYDFFEL